jgi:Flp pilus assembly protein TadD
LAGKKLPLVLGLAALAGALALSTPPRAAGAHTDAEIPGLAGPYLAAAAAEQRGDIAAAARWYAEALAADPRNTALLAKTIANQVAAGEIERALPLAERLEAADSGHHLGALVLAVEALRNGEAARARSLVETTAEGGGPFVGQLIAAWAAFAAGEASAARDILTKLEQSGSGGPAGDIIAAYHLALIDAAAGQDTEALAALERAAAKVETISDRLTRVRAGILARLGRLDEARAAVSARLDQTLGDPHLEALTRDLDAGTVPPPLVASGPEGAAEALYGVAGFLAQDNRPIALAYARLAVHLMPDLAEAQLLVGQMLAAQEQHALAIAAFEAVPLEAPEALAAAIGRARALESAGRTDEAIAVLRQTVAAHPRSIEARIALGDAQRRAERWVEAAEAYDAALALVERPERQHWALYYQRGIAYERADQWDKAEPDFLKALELEPDQPQVLNYLGYSWVEMRKNLGQAREMIEKAVDQRPKDGYIVDSLGWVLYRLGEFSDAARHLERAVELMPTDPVINDHFGDALWMIGRRTEARFQWKRALSFEPEERDAERIRRKLREGLDAVIAAEEAAGEPAVVRSTAGDPKPNGG